MALAGTQARPTDLALNLVRWGHKEVEEQALVSDYIHGFFHKAGIDDLQELGPQTTEAGNVVHLRTTFHVKRREDELLALANQVLYQLHPTSAVCGMPKDKALSFILAHENYDRSFYSGFLGPVHIGGESSLYVNLRCMQLQKQTANLYVGAGITAESQPAAEWRETVLKSETLLNVLRSTPAQAPQPSMSTPRLPALER
jgi:isochorismate synthase